MKLWKSEINRHIACKRRKSKKRQLWCVIEYIYHFDCDLCLGPIWCSQLDFCTLSDILIFNHFVYVHVTESCKNDIFAWRNRGLFNWYCRVIDIRGKMKKLNLSEMKKMERKLVNGADLKHSKSFCWFYDCIFLRNIWA